MTLADTLTPAGLRALRRAAKDKATRRRALPARDLHRAVQTGDIDGLKAALEAGASTPTRATGAAGPR